MKYYSKLLPLLFLVFLLNCSSSKTITTAPDEPTTEAVENETPVSEAADEETISSPAEDWHLESADSDPYYGTGTEKAYTEFLADKKPKKKVVVAIIDSGSDIDHEDLYANAWVNRDEISGNNEDDDNNGYIDDMHGWNFIGGADGSNVEYDTYELTRLYRAAKEQYEDADPATLSGDELEAYNEYKDLKDAYQAKMMEAQQMGAQIGGITQALNAAHQFFGVSDIDSVSADQLAPSEDDQPMASQLKQLVSAFHANGIKESDIKDAAEEVESMTKYYLNLDYDEREIVGDDYEDLSNRFYGNNDVIGTHNSHGTHVAGIVGAGRNNSVGMNGIATVELMIIRTVPDGDERDKDVANAIRYAAENGADIINMSFGKSYSPYKEYVDSAIKYADSVGVLMVHAAGNDGNDIDTAANYPSRYYEDGGMAANWITVGASSWHEDEGLTAPFSNYGAVNVDIFAPGVDIYSTFPDNEYNAISGTSMAAPVVSGVAALILSYYPELTTQQLRDVIMNSVTIPEQKEVVKPGSQTGELVPFSSLSVTGGIVNVAEALKLADKTVNSN